MKKFLVELLRGICIIVFGFFLFFLGYIFLPNRVVELKESLDDTIPQEYSSMSSERKTYLLSFDDFILKSATTKTKNILQLIYSNPYKLDRIILDDIQEEVAKYNGKNLKLWYVYNMGVIGKVDEDVVCFDLSTLIISINLLNLADMCDYLLISHGDGDHLNPAVVKKVLNNGGVVVTQDETGILKENIQSLVPKILWENVYNLANKEQYKIDEISILGIKTMRRMDDQNDNTWFRVKIKDYNIVHTGDGVLDNYEDMDFLGEVDVLLSNVIVNPLSLEDVNAEYVIPLHMHELGHNREFLEENSYTSYFEVLDSYRGNLRSKVYPLVWGESIEIE